MWLCSPNKRFKIGFYPIFMRLMDKKRDLALKNEAKSILNPCCETFSFRNGVGCHKLHWALWPLFFTWRLKDQCQNISWNHSREVATIYSDKKMPLPARWSYSLYTPNCHSMVSTTTFSATHWIGWWGEKKGKLLRLHEEK